MQNAIARGGQTAAAPARASAAGIPLFHAAWLYAAGIGAASVAWLRPGVVLVSVVIAAVACGAAASRAQRLAWLPLAALWLLLGAWSAEMQPTPAPDRPLLALSDGLLREVEGTVTNSGPIRGEPGQDMEAGPDAKLTQRIDVGLDSIEVVTDALDAQQPVNGKVRLTVRWPRGTVHSSLLCGDRVRAFVRLLPPETYRDAGAWSRTAYLAEQGITSTASVDASRIERLGRAEHLSLGCLLSGAQRNAADRLLKLPAAMSAFPAPLRMSQEDAIMLTAMVTGDRTFLAHSLRAGFERTGSFHMLVVSGFHLAIVAGFILWLARRLRIPRVPATVVTIGASFVYALFTGFATPVQRSFWMIALYLVCRLAYRERSSLNAIGFAALCLLAANPRSIFDASFQMTLLAVVSIAGIAVPLLDATIHPYVNATRELRLVAIDVKLTPRLAQFRIVLRMIAARLSSAFNRRAGSRVFPWAVRSGLQVVCALAISFVAELAMTLPMAVYFHRITIFALPVNVLILPLLFLLMPAALITLIALAVWPAAAVVPAVACAALLHAGVGTVRLFGSLRVGDLRIATPSAWQAAAFCGLVALAVLLARSSRPLWRRSAWAALLAAALTAVWPRAIEHPHDALLVEALDVGQGDSLLLITPDGKTLLVDGGGFGGGPRQMPQEFDIGEEVVSPALWARGIRRLDAVALSHAHSDHMGGLPAVLRNFHPGELWVGNNPRVPAYNALLSEADALHSKLRTLRAGDALMFGGMQVRVLAPSRSYQPGDEPSNNDSLVLHAGYGASSVLLEGDAEAPVEQGMLASAGLESTLLKVGHHGSTTSTTPDFLARVSPQWAVISCGLRNRYGHPREEVLKELQDAHVRTLSTDVSGAVCFRMDGKSVSPLDSCSESR